MYWDKQGALLVNRLGRSNSITLILVKYGMFSCMLANKLLHCMKYLLYSWLLLPSFRWVLHVQLQNFSQTKGQFLQFAFQDFLTDEEAETTDILYRAKQGALLVNRLGRTNSLTSILLKYAMFYGCWPKNKWLHCMKNLIYLMHLLPFLGAR